MAYSLSSSPTPAGNGATLETTGSSAEAGLAQEQSLLAGRKRRWLEAGLIVAFWGCIFMLNVGQRAFDPRGPEGLTARQVVHPALEYVLWLLLTPGIFWLSHRFSIDQKNWLRHLAMHAAVALGVAVAMDAFGHFTYHALIRQESRAFSLARSLTSLRFLDELIIYLTVLAASFARDYFWRYQEHLQETLRIQAHASQLETHAARLEKQLTEARLDALRMQINPHFLFNTLHAVSTLVGEDPRGVRRMISRLSELLRYTLESRGGAEVPLQEELDFLEDYLEIQRIRFQGSLDVHYDVEPDVLDALMPNLILQPLVENAIKHGVSRIEGTGRLVLRARREGDALRVCVEDNGPGMDAEAIEKDDREGVGLRNTRERLESLYGQAQQLVLRPNPEGGLVVEIMLPYHTRRDLHARAAADEAS